MLIGLYPNTYCFTKSMAERAIKERSGTLNVVIVRPSIIIAAYREPLQGWTGNLAAGGVVVFAGTNGLLKITSYEPETTIDLVPIDYVCNTILSATAFTGLHE